MKIKEVSTKFDVSVLGEDAQEIYSRLYGDKGLKYIEILETSPEEIAVISRLLAYLENMMGGEQCGSAENS